MVRQTAVILFSELQVLVLEINTDNEISYERLMLQNNVDPCEITFPQTSPSNIRTI